MPLFRFNIVSRSDIERSRGGNMMLQAIDSDDRKNQLIVGIPGSGKTTVTIMRAQRLANQGKRILLFTYQNLLRTSLLNMADSNLKPHIFGFYSWYSSKFGFLDKSEGINEMRSKMALEPIYDEILIDEGQDFEERIYQSLLDKCRRMTVGADNAQKVHDHGLLADQIAKQLHRGEAPVTVRLEYNYRNTYENYNFARYFVPDNIRANNPVTIDKMTRGSGSRPVLMQVGSEVENLERIQIILENNSGKNCVLLVYHQSEVDYYHTKIIEMGFSCSKHYYGHDAGLNLENILVTTYKSAKGLEFQVVIMPDMQTAMDKPQKTAEHYYIGCTRTQEALFLLYQGAALPDCLSAFPEDSYEFVPREGLTKDGIIDDLPF